MHLSPGARLGPYELLGLLGAGGMGAVYRARDTRLDRVVAVKVLRPEFAGDSARRQRLAREARAIARLTHPHICTLHEFDSAPSPADGEAIEFLVMEYLDGETLAARLRRTAQGPRRGAQARSTEPTSDARSPKPASALPLSEALAIAIQIADALAAAHRQGIVHRDLKPGNIMLTGPGAGRSGAPQVKLLDFGLVRLREPAGRAGPSVPTETDPLTAEGAILGTVQYMAPEQLEGKEADARTDLFALGAIVYEMVTGRKAFEGDSQASVIAAILEHDPPPLTERAPLAPPALERVIEKSLAKDPDRRWHAAQDMADELRWILQDSGMPQTAPSPAEASRRGIKASGAIATVGAVALAVWWVTSSSAPLLPMRTMPLTTYPGEEREPALSPDGEHVAFTWQGPSGEGPFNLYVKLVSGGEPLLIHEAPSDVFSPEWSPDGRQIAFIRHIGAEDDAPNDGVFIVSALGGAARQLGVFRGLHGLWSLHRPSWSPDGQWLAVSHGEPDDTPTAIYLFSLSTGARRRVTHPPPGFAGDATPRFSPDGRALAFMRVREVSQEEIYVVSVDGGEARRLTFNESNLRGLDWTPDGHALVFSAYLPGRPDQFGLWRVAASGGEPEPLEVGEVGLDPSLSRVGRRLAYARAIRRYTIWRMGGPTAASGEAGPQRLIESTSGDSLPAYSPDGRTIAFSSRRSGPTEIWLASSDGTNPRQLTFLNQFSIAPRWSPKGDRLTFFSSRDDQHDVYVVSVAGGVPHTVTTEASNDVAPSWSRDGRSLYFRSDRSGRLEIWKLPIDEGLAVQLTHQGGFATEESIDGRILYFSKSNVSGGPSGLWSMPTGGGSEVRVLDHPRHDMWSVFEGGICYLNRGVGPYGVIEFYDSETGKIREIARLADPVTDLGLSVSPDGRWILYVRDESVSDIMVVENFR